MNSYRAGNAFSEGDAQDPKGWFIGHFIRSQSDIRYSSDVEVKFVKYDKGITKAMDGTAAQDCTTLTMLIQGSFTQIMPDKEYLLEKRGDYVLWGPGIDHGGRAEENGTEMLTIRWPSISRKK